MDASLVYQDYLALKSHFTSKYNYHMYQGKIKTSPKAVSFVRDKLFFEKVGKHRDPHTFLLANILQDKKAFIRNIAYSKDAERNYVDYTARMQALTYVFKQDLKKLVGDFDDNIMVLNNSHPHLVVLYLSKEISLETICIVSAISKCLEYWERKLEYEPVINEVIFKIRKYMPFIKFDKSVFKKVIVDEFNSR